VRALGFHRCRHASNQRRIANGHVHRPELAELLDQLEPDRPRANRHVGVSRVVEQQRVSLGCVRLRRASRVLDVGTDLGESRAERFDPTDFHSVGPDGHEHLG